MIRLYVLRLSVVCLSVVSVLATFLLSCDIWGMLNVLQNSSILESSGSTVQEAINKIQGQDAVTIRAWKRAVDVDNE